MGSRGRTFLYITARPSKASQMEVPSESAASSFSTMKSLGKPYSLCCT